MPTDTYGNVAHMVGSDVAITARKNPGVLDEHQLNGFSKTLLKWIRSTLKINEEQRYRDQITNVAEQNPTLLSTVWSKLLRYYEITSPLTFETLSLYSTEQIINHMTVVLKRNIVIYKTIGSEPMPDVFDKLLPEFPIEKSVVRFRLDGKDYISEEKVLIAPVKYILLDKTARDLSGVASAYSQIHGLPAAPDSIARTKHPFKRASVKFWGEQEGPIAAAICGNEFVAESMDRNSNPATNTLIVEAILDAVQPTNIEKLIDRAKHPYGNTRSLELFRSYIGMGGFGYEYIPEERRIVKLE